MPRPKGIKETKPRKVYNKKSTGKRKVISVHESLIDPFRLINKLLTKFNKENVKKNKE